MVTLPVLRHRRGRVEPSNLAHLREVSFHQHAHTLRALKAKLAPPAAYDCRTLTPAFIPVLEETDDDQAQCGSCWCFSGTEVAEAALMKAGALTLTQRLSKEYTLDCGKNGGCDGDDNTTVLQWAEATGLPLSAAYGPYSAGNGRTGSCKYTSGMSLYKIDSWGFADSNGGQGVTSTADIKTAIMAYGMVGCAVAAGNDWDSVGPGQTITGTSTNIDHDVALVGWDDNHDNGDGSKGAWIMRNSWGPSWGDGGYAWIKYGADSIGTETVFAVKAGTPPPPPPPPPPVCQNTLNLTTAIATGTTAVPGLGSLVMCQALPVGLYGVTFTLIPPTPPPTPGPTQAEFKDVSAYLAALAGSTVVAPPAAAELTDVGNYLLAAAQGRK